MLNSSPARCLALVCKSTFWPTESSAPSGNAPTKPQPARSSHSWSTNHDFLENVRSRSISRSALPTSRAYLASCARRCRPITRSGRTGFAHRIPTPLTLLRRRHAHHERTRDGAAGDVQFPVAGDRETAWGCGAALIQWFTLEQFAVAVILGQVSVEI